jgi:Holliday junction resolvase RusA-like endonuclease
VTAIQEPLPTAAASPSAGDLTYTVALPVGLPLLHSLDEVEVVAQFRVDGEPVSKARARFTKQGSKSQAYTPEKTHVAEQTMAWHFRAAARAHKPEGEAAYGVAARFCSGTRQRRDVDNMMKLLLDGLNGVAWADDNQVVEISARKELVDRASAHTDVLVYKVGQVQRNLATCEYCANEYNTYESWAGQRRFCSAACFYAWSRERRERECEHCGTSFSPHAVEAPPKYCSRTCANEARRATVACDHCGVTISKQRCFVRALNYCSAQCREAAARGRAAASRLRGRGTCMTCGGFTSKKNYKQCRGCHRGTAEPRGAARVIADNSQHVIGPDPRIGEPVKGSQLVIHIIPEGGTS